MSEYAVMPYSDYANICNSVRAKTGGEAVLLSGEVAAEIDGIDTVSNQDITVTENGQYQAEEGYTGLGTVTVAVPAEEPVLEDLTVNENGEYTPGEGVDGFGKVTVEVEGTGSGNILDYSQSLNTAFSATVFETGTELDISFGTKAPLINTQATYGTFHKATGLKSIKLSCGFATATNVSMQNFARSAQAEYELEVLDLTGLLNVLRPTTVQRAFEFRKGLREILGEFDMTNCTIIGESWAACSALETVRFKQETIKISLSFAGSPLLTETTVQSIIDGLADLTDSTAQTLTLHADVGAKLTDEQKSAASAKNWTISY